MRAVAAIIVVCSGLLASGLLSGSHRKPLAAAPARPADAKPYGLDKKSFAQVSSASCAAAACHGGGRIGRRGSEHSTWAATLLPEATSDPHARAYRVLFNEES